MLFYSSHCHIHNFIHLRKPRSVDIALNDVGHSAAVNSYYYYYYNHFMPRWILSGTTWVSLYQKGKTKNQSGFPGARDSKWQWDQLGHMQICTLSQTNNHASTPPLSFLQDGYPSCHPTNSVKALKACSTQ